MTFNNVTDIRIC